MKVYAYILGCLLTSILFQGAMQAQSAGEVQGQVSGWMAGSQGDPLNVSVGLRYIPQYNFSFPLKKDRLFDIETSVNILGTAGFETGRDDYATIGVRPYRMWARYSTNQFELRLGLQKISFGAASSLRPLMWFDQIDPRDPLRLTNGVWGGLGRYYFLNNANVWFWVLWGNEQTKGWEALTTSKNIPEAGARIQYPVKKGEIGLSYHFRTVDSKSLPLPTWQYDRIPENRVGIDAKFDLAVGLWVEGSWVHKHQDVGILTDQTILNAGIDYTFGLGNGLSVIAEQLVLSYDETPFAFTDPNTLTALTASYPIGMFDNLSAVVFYDWTGKNLISLLNWKKDFEKVSLFVIAYWNTSTGEVINNNQLGGNFTGKGVQIMILFNH